MDSKLYPQGKTPHFAKYVNGVLKYFKRSNVAEIFAVDGNAGILYEAGKEYVVRSRCTVAEINAGKTIVPAVPGHKIQVTEASAIAYGGAVTGLTTLDVLGTQSTSAVKLAAFAQASLAQSTRLVSGASGAAILADGASFAQNDVNTAITVNKTGGSAATATGVDVVVRYTLVRA